MLIDRLITKVRMFFGETLETSLRRRLRAASPASLAELREGLHCRIAGAVRTLDGQVLTAPLTGRRCVAYMLEITQADHEFSSLLIGLEVRAVPFVVEAGEHRALVDATHARLLTATDVRVTVRHGFRSDPVHHEILDRFFPDRSFADVRALRYREIAVEVGRPISIAGTGHREVDPLARIERGFRDLGQQRLRIRGEATLPLLIGDDPP